MDKLQSFVVNMQYVRVATRSVVVSCNLSMKIYQNVSKTWILILQIQDKTQKFCKSEQNIAISKWICSTRVEKLLLMKNALKFPESPEFPGSPGFQKWAHTNIPSDVLSLLPLCKLKVKSITIRRKVGIEQWLHLMKIGI